MKDFVLVVFSKVYLSIEIVKLLKLMHSDTLLALLFSCSSVISLISAHYGVSIWNYYVLKESNKKRANNKNNNFWNVVSKFFCTLLTCSLCSEVVSYWSFGYVCHLFHNRIILGLANDLILHLCDVKAYCLLYYLASSQTTYWKLRWLTDSRSISNTVLK